ncbi:MAG: DUF262 domain-containing HNH endonuclease family protein [Hyphomicrobium sp.]
MFSKLPTASLTVANLLSGTFRFVVPAYQRAYSWTRDEAGQLLDDLLSAAGLDDQASAEPDYFLGTVLFMDRGGLDGWTVAAASAGDSGQEAAERVVDIVDGQQRLITLSVLAAVLRDLAVPEARFQHDSGADSVLWSRLDGLMALPVSGRSVSGPRRHRLELPGSDQDFIVRYVLSPGAATEMPEGEGDDGAGARAILDVREQFLSVLGDLEPAARRTLATYMCDQAHVVAILTRDMDRAHRYFMVLNDRGRPLMRSDILKAEVLSDVPSVRAGVAREAWDRSSRLLGERFDQFFSHLKAIHGINRPQVIDAVRSVVTAAGGAEPFVLQTMAPMAEVYRKILGVAVGDDGLPPEIVRALVYLGRLSGEEWAPAAMLAVGRHLDGDGDAARMLLEVDRQAHLMRLLLIGRDKRVRRFAAIAAAIRAGEQLGGGAALFQPTRDEVKSMAFNLQSLWRRNPSFAKLLLLRLSDEIGGTLTRVDPADLSVEHVLPQRPPANSVWRRTFPDAEMREALTQCLGNLVLVSQRKNDALGNVEFDQKRAILARLDRDAPGVALLGDIINSSTWGSSDIRARDARLTEIVGKLFRIDVKPAAVLR